MRANNAFPDFVDIVQSFTAGKQRISNLEMETAGIYALAKTLGHKALSVNAILDSRVKFEFSSEPAAIIDKAIQLVLSKLN